MTVTIDGSNGITFPNSSTQAVGFYGFKNRIINGGMVIDQRDNGASVTITNTSARTYTVDRWSSYGTVASKFSVQQNAGSVTLPVGFTNYLGFTSLSAYSVGSGDIFNFSQAIEGFNVADLAWGTSNAKTITLSFQVYSSLTGTFGGSITNSNNTRCYPFSFTVSSANTWTSISITVAGDTTGTWGTGNGAGITVGFSLGMGSTYTGTANAWTGSTILAPTGSVSVVGTNGATFYITGVQLEVGIQATSFDYRPYGTELALCQRYYQLAQGAAGIVSASSTTSGNYYVAVQFNVAMRAYPSGTVIGTLQVNNVLLANPSITSSNNGIFGIYGSGISGSWSSGSSTGYSTGVNIPATAIPASSTSSPTNAFAFSAEL